MIVVTKLCKWYDWLLAVYLDTTPNMLVDGCLTMKKFENINIKKLNGWKRKKERLRSTDQAKRFDFLMLNFDLREPCLNVNSNFFVYRCAAASITCHPCECCACCAGWILYLMCLCFTAYSSYMLYYVCKCH